MPPFPPNTVWIGSEHAFDLHEAYLCFRSPARWCLERKPYRAELFISADSRYKLWVNGQFVARGPARCYPHAQVVDCLNLAPYLQAGANTLAVQVYQPGYSHFAYVHRGAAGLLAHLICDDQSVLVSNACWRTRRDPSFAATVPSVSIYGGGVEVRDLNLAEDWQNPAYDDSNWAAARVVAPVGGYPWTGLQPRSVPLFLEAQISPTLVETRLCRSAPSLPYVSVDPHLALRVGWLAALPHIFEADAEDWYQPVLAEGESAFWLFDLGRGYSCQGWFEAQEAGGQEEVSLHYTEKMQADGQLYISDPQTYCRVRMTDHFCLRPGNQRGEPFAMRGGRLLLFKVSGPTGPAFRIRFHIQVAEYPLELSCPLVTADSLLNKIITLCEDTVRACLLDGFVDNPWRESAQWVGDALPAGLTLATISNDVRPLRRVLELAAQGAYPDGVLPSVLPSEAHAYVIVDFNFQWVELLHTYAVISSEAAFVQEMWPTLVKLLARFSQDVNVEGLIISQIGRRLFLDWAPISRQEPNAIYNLHFLLALQQAADLAAHHGFTGDAARWSAQAMALQSAIRRAFWRDGRWYDDRESSTFSQLAAALAVLTQTATPTETSTLLPEMAARSLNLDDSHQSGQMVLASPYMHHRVLAALRQGGRSDLAVEIIRRRWGRWVEGGYPTAWENWNVDFPDGSQCHGFSAHPRYHLAQIACEQGGL